MRGQAPFPPRWDGPVSSTAVIIVEYSCNILLDYGRRERGTGGLAPGFRNVTFFY